MKDFFWDDGYIKKTLLTIINYKMIIIIKILFYNLIFRHIYIAMEYCDGGDLSNFIKKKSKLAENICRKFLQQLALALKYLRDRFICHMDLKPQNLLLMKKPTLTLKVGGL